MRFLLLDIMQHPPLRHLDLILCRNVLIYFEREKQHHILEIFHQCLRPGGFLVLGKSEAILGMTESGLVPFSRRERVYRKEGAYLQGRWPANGRGRDEGKSVRGGSRTR